MNETTNPSEQNNKQLEQKSLLDRSLAAFWSWDWEKTAWLALLAVAVVSRFAGLADRSMSHDESEHAWFAYNLYSGAGYQHSPVYHGPFAYHVLALFYLIFGDSTLMARVPTALFGVGVILLIWPMRRWLGRLGAFLAATMVTFSPAILHYSRHTRHDMYEIFWVLMLVLSVFKYLEARRGIGASASLKAGAGWLYLSAASLSLMLAIKEVAFIDGAAVGGFVILIILYRWFLGDPELQAEEAAAGAARKGSGKRESDIDRADSPHEVESADPLRLSRGRELPVRLVRRDWLVLGGILALSLIGALIFKLLGLGQMNYNTAGASGLLQSLLRLLPALLPPLAAVGLAVWYLGRRNAGEDGPALAFSRPIDVAIALGTLILPWLSPFLISALGYDPLDYSFPSGVLPSLSVLLGMVGLAIAVGILWDARRWLIAAGVFYGIFVFFFTTAFTNGQGIATGLIGSLGYWLSQHEVARGGQSWYYYLLIVPLYEFLPIILTIPVVLRAVVRRERISLILLVVILLGLAGWLAMRTAIPALRAGASVGGDPLSNLDTFSKLFALVTLVSALLAAAWGGFSRNPQRERYFLAFLPFWALFSWIVYTVAGEKMPWLTTHISLPMCLAGGWWLGQVVERIDWSAVRQRGGLWVAVLVVPLLAALVSLLNSKPFQDRTIESLSETTQWLAALAAVIVVAALLIRQGKRLGWRDTLRVAGLTLVLLLSLWSVRTSYMLNFINYDYTTEFLFYAHASPDPARVMAEIEEISRRTAGDKQLKVAYDDDASWPFNWYLRDWPNGAYFGASPSREALDAPVVLAGSKNLDKVRPFLQRDYYEFDNRLIWWPDEGYKNTGWQKIWQGITDPAKRKEFLDVVIWRKYPTSTAQWPLVHRFSFFVKKDLAAQLWDFGAQPTAAVEYVDPYEAGQREVSSLRQIGGIPGLGAGQFNQPRNVAVAPDGRVYVADSGNHRIEVFSPDGAYLLDWGGSCELYAEGQPNCVDPDGAGPLELADGQMREPWGVAMGPDGTVYVADTWNHRILAFDGEGKLLGKWGSFVTTNGEAVDSPGGFWGPRSIAIDAAGNLYVTDTGNKRIQVFDGQGNFLGQFGGGGVIEGRFDEPVGLAIVPLAEGKPGGRLYVADTWNRRVQVFDVVFDGAQPQFLFVREWPIEGWSSQSVVNKPYLAVDPQRNRVYVTDPELWRVLVFDGDGNFKATFGFYGSDAQSMTLPTGIDVGPDGNVYVVDADNHRVMIFPPVQ